MTDEMNDAGGMGPEEQPQAPMGGGEPPSKDARTFAMLAHLLGALIGFLGPLIVWLIKKDESPFVDDQGKEALNYQITLAIGYVVAMALSCAGIGLVLFPILMLLQIIFGIIGAVKANNGEWYRYPWALRLIK